LLALDEIPPSTAHEAFLPHSPAVVSSVPVFKVPCPVITRKFTLPWSLPYSAPIIMITATGGRSTRLPLDLVDRDLQNKVEAAWAAAQQALAATGDDLRAAGEWLRMQPPDSAVFGGKAGSW
jgi:hypothetical protein